MMTFAEFVDRAISHERMLPLMHTTDVFALREVTRSQALTVDQCPVYGENLLYFFYGKPTYRPKGTGAPTSISAFNLCGFIMDGQALPTPRRVLPFDSGGFERDLYKPFMHPGMNLQSFELSASLESASKLVAAFFKTNYNYLNGVLDAVAASEFDLEVKSYFAMVSSAGTSLDDDRRSTVEVQYDVDVELASGNVVAIVVPSSISDDPEFSAFASNLDAEVLTYDTFRNDPAENSIQIRQAVKSFLDRPGAA